MAVEEEKSRYNLHNGGTVAGRITPRVSVYNASKYSCLQLYKDGTYTPSGEYRYVIVINFMSRVLKMEHSSK